MSLSAGKLKNKPVRILFLCGLLVGTGVGLLAASQQQYSQRRATVASWRSVPVTPPPGKPEISQKSIDLALAIYGIDVPASATYPVLNAALVDRGLSTKHAWSDKIVVEIGPAAFSSWGLLGSTMAHELEVHCQQNFVLINLLDSFGFDGTAYAERQAYMHELENAKRFGLSDLNRELIASTMDYYYAIDESESNNILLARMRRTISQFLARRAIQ